MSGADETTTTVIPPIGTAGEGIDDLSICKKNVNGDELPGAELTLTGKDYDGNDIIFDITNITLGNDAELITTEDGASLSWRSGSTATIVHDLPEGVYILHEVAAPDGYEVATDITFTIKDGEVSGDAEVVTDGSVTMIDNMIVTSTTTTTTTTTTTMTTTTVLTSTSSDAPKTGSAGVGTAAIALIFASAAAFAARKKHND